MKTGKLNKSGQIVGLILMGIGAGAVVNFFSSKRNRTKIQKKAKEIGTLILDEVNAKKRLLGKW